MSLVRKADMFCESCGKAAVRSHSSAAPGKYKCLPCRRRERSYEVKSPRATPRRVYPRSPWVIAIELGDSQKIIETMLANTDDVGGCRVWRRRGGSGYISTKVRGRHMQIHRVMAEAVYGRLGALSVHHKCANQACINPEHLQPVSQRENIAEMLERNGYIREIATLRQALALLDPDHPLLRQTE